MERRFVKAVEVTENGHTESGSVTVCLDRMYEFDLEERKQKGTPLCYSHIRASANGEQISEKSSISKKEILSAIPAFIRMVEYELIKKFTKAEEVPDIESQLKELGFQEYNIKN
jgi:hypothetical protein